MKHVEIKKSEHDGLSCSSDAHYPYGTSLTISDELFDDLELVNLAVGDTVMVHATAIVESKHEHDHLDHESNRSVSLQLTSICVKREDPDRVGVMYSE